MVGTDERRGWVGKSDRGSDLKGAGYGSFSQNLPYMFFPAATDQPLAPLDRAPPPAVAILLATSLHMSSSTPWVSMLDLKSFSRRRARALLYHYFPVVRRQLHPTPASHR
jgi:hypothetical protein